MKKGVDLFVNDYAGRPVSASDGTTTYASAVEYAPHGAVSSMHLGNDLVETTTFNSRLQPDRMTLNPAAASTTLLLQLDFGYGTTNNGNLVSQTITASGLPTFSQTYGYDPLNRISSVAETGPASWSQNFTYDRYGNRAATGLQVSVATPASIGAYTSSNRLTTSWALYDDAGNMTAFKNPNGTAAGQWSAAYDGENKQRYYCAETIAACGPANDTAEYVYDGEGNRVQKLTSSSTTIYVYDAFGRLAAEYNMGGPSEEAGTFYRTTDHLGSTRLVTDAAGDVVSRRDFFPFGEEIDANASSGRAGIAEYNEETGFPQLFTGKERDEESGLDYFGARYMSSAWGRFTSPDEPFADQDESDPQSWNLYSYVRNNPLIFTDPTGNDCVYLNNAGDAVADINDQNTAKDCGKTGGYWVDGTVTNARFAHGSLILTGTKSGEDRTSASYALGPDEGLVAVQRGTQMAAPGVNLAGQGLMAFGSLVAPLPMAIAHKASGNGSDTDVALAMIPGGGGLKLGGKFLKIDPSKPLRTYLAGARLARGEKFPEHLLDFTGKQLKELVDQGSVTPDQVRKIAKVIESGQRLMEKLGGK